LVNCLLDEIAGTLAALAPGEIISHCLANRQHSSLRSSRVKNWEIVSKASVEAFWLKVRDVPGRTEGRKDRPEERYCLGVYLLALAQHGLLDYPCNIEQGDAPDFMITKSTGEKTGLEVTRATEPWFQRQMTEADRKYDRRKIAAAATVGHEPEPVAWFPSSAGWAGDQAEEEWCVLVQGAVEKKLTKLPGFRPASHYDLLVYDDTPLPAVDRRKVMAALALWAQQIKQQGPPLGRISVIISLDVLFDVGGASRIFPYIEWSTPDFGASKSAQTFSERAVYAGRAAAEQAIRAHKMARAPIYFLDGKGRLVKQTFDGRRFEVRVRDDGEEVVVQELPLG
jgi:hypothetical protein